MAHLGTVPDLGGAGTPESTWSKCRQLVELATWRPEPPTTGRVFVVAPHPDDEILGAGGTIALLSRARAIVELVAVTDGEHSHPGMEDQLRAVRPQESLAAAARLGIDFHRIHRLQHRDGRIDETGLGERLESLIGRGDLVLAPWPWDGHPDHDAVGRAAEKAAAVTGASLLAYLVWAWHWAAPTDVPWARARRVDLAHLAPRKRDAVACFRSQTSLEPVVLPAHVRRRLLRSYEVVLRP